MISLVHAFSHDALLQGDEESKAFKAWNKKVSAGVAGEAAADEAPFPPKLQPRKSRDEFQEAMAAKLLGVSKPEPQQLQTNQLEVQNTWISA